MIEISDTFLRGQDTPNELEQPGEEESEPKPRYFIDFKWYEENNRSFSAFARSRLCFSCQSKQEVETERSIPVEGSDGKVMFQTSKATHGDDLLVVIRDCCSQARGFITPDLPVMEIVFRILLANGNQPLTLEEIRARLEEKLTGADRPRTLSSEMLQRILDNDVYYGLRCVPTSADVQSNTL